MMRKSLPRKSRAAMQQSMLGRISSLLVLVGLVFGVLVMPMVAHASTNGPLHASEMVDDHEIVDADHSHSRGDDKDVPCHAVSHHHCSIALRLDGPRIAVNTLTQGALLRPGASAPLVSRSQAPPLDPPLA